MVIWLAQAADGETFAIGAQLSRPKMFASLCR